MTVSRKDSKKKEISDEELVLSIREGNDEGLQLILDRYRNLVKKRARAVYLVGGDADDLIQEGMIGLYNAVKNYDRSKAPSFAAFADLCVTRRICNAVKADSRQKNVPLNNYIPLTGYDDEEGGNVLLNRIAPEMAGPEALVLSYERSKQVVEIIENVLSTYERKVLIMYLDGMSYTEISRQLGKPEKSVDNALQRIKNKMKSAIDKK